MSLPGCLAWDEDAEYDDEEEYGECLVMSLCISYPLESCQPPFIPQRYCSAKYVWIIQNSFVGGCFSFFFYKICFISK